MVTRLFIRCWICLCCVACIWGTQANALTVDESSSGINLASKVALLADPSGKLTINDIRSSAISAQFQPADPFGQDLNFGFTNSTYWIRLTLSRTEAASHDWVLSVPFQSIDALTFYTSDKQPVVTGNLLPFSSRPIKDPFYAFPIQLDTTPQVFYLQAKSAYALTLPLVLWTAQDFFEQAQNSSFIQALYFGELLALVLYNFLIFLYLRNKSFIFYTLFGVAMGMAMFAGNGYGRLYLWPDAPYWDGVAQYACLSLAALFGILFTNSFLQTQKNTPRLRKILLAMAVCFVLIATLLPVARVIGLPVNILFITFALAAPTTTLLFVLTAFLALSAGQREARFFLLAWGILWVSGFIAAMRAFGVVPSTPFTNYAVQIGSAIEMLLLSFALGYQIRVERQAREKMQEEKLAVEQTLVKSLKESEEKLESTVALRTSALQESLANETKLREMYVRFGAFISHEFRNPLNLIESQVALFRRERERQIDNGGQRLNIIGSATHQLAELFNRWLETDKLNHALTKAEVTRSRLDDWLPDFIGALQQLHEHHVLQLTPFDAAITLDADVRLVKTALINLIDNACKYAEAHTNVVIALVSHAGQTGISMRDQGCGIPAEERPRIFDEYYRCEATSNIRGIGLGLAFVKQIMELHGGTVTLESTPGEGSCFTLWFPNRDTGN